MIFEMRAFTRDFWLASASVGWRAAIMQRQRLRASTGRNSLLRAERTRMGWVLSPTREGWVGC